MSTDQTLSLTADGRADLVRLLRVAYPHPRFPDGPYERTADAIASQVAASVWHRMTLVTGLESLSSEAGRFRDLDDEAAAVLVAKIADAEFFVFIRGVAVTTLYNDAEVWELLGYEGASFDQGGYLERGFDDLDWLPDPRVGEYDGPEPLVEVADADRPEEGSR